MLFMVIERIKDGDGLQLYRRLREKPAVLPEGLKVHGSWMEAGFGRCFQIMECDDLKLFQQWVLSGLSGLVEFEVVPVTISAETRPIVAPFLEAASGGQ